LLSASNTNITDAIRWLNRFGIEAAFFVPTKTGLAKSIIDAHFTLREYLRINEIHDYEQQDQGDKVYLECHLIKCSSAHESRISLYRPNTKKGDPRFWISKLGEICTDSDLIALYVRNGSIYIINLSDAQIRSEGLNTNSWLNNFLIQGRIQYSQPAFQLLSRLKSIHDFGWVRTTRPGDTGVGHTLETLLGIRANSLPYPDFHGIEIKAKRISSLKHADRTTLFAKVPDWSISEMKSSAEILESFGYFRDDLKKLYCTVSAQKPNAQGLQFILDFNNATLNEVYVTDIDLGQIKDVVRWRLQTLEAALLSKHRETFWVYAENKIEEDEYFFFRKADHSRNPSITNFRHLLEVGVITMDHLIKDRDGRVSEKGPLFKIKSDSIDLLIPLIGSYDLST
jgi:hypothetical protein